MEEGPDEQRGVAFGVAGAGQGPQRAEHAEGEDHALEGAGEAVGVLVDEGAAGEVGAEDGGEGVDGAVG